jgi:hypothetical protein
MVPILLRAAAAAASPGSYPSSDDLADDDDNHLTRAGPITKHQIQQSTTRIQHSHTCSRTPVLTFLQLQDAIIKWVEEYERWVLYFVEV